MRYWISTYVMHGVENFPLQEVFSSRFSMQKWSTQRPPTSSVEEGGAGEPAPNSTKFLVIRAQEKSLLL